VDGDSVPAADGEPARPDCEALMLFEAGGRTDC